jgi:surface antigen
MILEKYSDIYKSVIAIAILGLFTCGSVPIANYLSSQPAIAKKAPKKVKSSQRQIKASAEPVPAADALPSIAKLGIDLNGDYYRASGNQLIAWNEEIRGAHSFECVEFVYGRAIERRLMQNKQGIATVLIGNADTWVSRVANSKYRDRLSNKVRINSVIAWDANVTFRWREGDYLQTWTTDPIAGHVAFVEKVYADGSFLISEGIHQQQPVVRLIKAGSSIAAAAKFIYL